MVKIVLIREHLYSHGDNDRIDTNFFFFSRVYDTRLRLSCVYQKILITASFLAALEVCYIQYRCRSWQFSDSLSPWSSSTLFSTGLFRILPISVVFRHSFWVATAQCCSWFGCEDDPTRRAFFMSQGSVSPLIWTSLAMAHIKWLQSGQLIVPVSL